MYFAKEQNGWPTSSDDFKTIEEAIAWGHGNLKGKWAVFKHGIIGVTKVWEN